LSEPEGGRPAVVACTVAHRGRVAVAEPFFEPGPPFTLGRRLHAAAADGELVLVAPRGRWGGEIVEVLGSPADIHAVMHGLAGETGAAEPWPDDVRRELRGLPEGALPPDPGRSDLRGLLTFTIDPEGAKDHDDALSVHEGTVFVHIADVAAFVPQAGPLDLEAEWRSTSVYLPGRVDPMLPPQLSDDLCSLAPGRDRWAVTVELRPGGAAHIARSVIRSDHRLTYREADAILAGGPGPDDLAAAVRAASAVADRLRAERLARGALEVGGRDLVFAFADGRVADAHTEPGSPAHTLIEQLMIRANERVAERLARGGQPAVYRVHEPPDAAALEALVERLEALDVPTPPMPDLHTGPPSARYAGALSAAVARRVQSTGRGGGAFTALVLRSLKQARYHPANLGHTGLASAAYCHFTSPIRRYPDLICHRAILRELGLVDAPPPGDLEWVAEHSSDAERGAAALERRGSDICLAHLLDARLYDAGWDATFAGEVVGLIESGAFVRFDGVFEGLLPARLIGGDRFALDPLGVALVGYRSGHRIRLGDALDVRVRSIDRPAGKVLLELAR
jgi:ribonuclease R